MGVGPTSLSSIAPGWKGGKLPPLGGSLGEYSLNDFDEQPAENGAPKCGVAQHLGSGLVAASLAASCVRMGRAPGADNAILCPPTKQGDGKRCY